MLLRIAVEEFCQHSVAVRFGFFFSSLQALFADSVIEAMPDEHLIDDFRCDWAKFVAQKIVAAFVCPFFRFRASAFFWIFEICPCEKFCGGASDCFFVFVVFSCGEHDVYMDVVRPVAHCPDFVMYGIGIVMIFQFAVDEVFHDFFLRFKWQFVWKRIHNFLVPLTVRAFVKIGGLEEFFWVVPGPSRKEMPFADTTASLLEGSFAVDVLDVAICICPLQFFLQIGQNLVCCFYHLLSSCVSETPSRSFTVCGSGVEGVLGGFSIPANIPSHSRILFGSAVVKQYSRCTMQKHRSPSSSTNLQTAFGQYRHTHFFLEGRNFSGTWLSVGEMNERSCPIFWTEDSTSGSKG